MNEQLAAIKARRDAITPGVWEPRISKETTDHEVTMYDAEIDYTVTVAVCNSILRYMDNEPNARFIAAAPADIDVLLAMVDSLESIIDKQDRDIVTLQNALRDNAAERDALAAQLAQVQRELARSEELRKFGVA